MEGSKRRIASGAGGATTPPARRSHRPLTPNAGGQHGSRCEPRDRGRLAGAGRRHRRSRRRTAPAARRCRCSSATCSTPATLTDIRRLETTGAAGGIAAGAGTRRRRAARPRRLAGRAVPRDARQAHKRSNAHAGDAGTLRPECGGRRLRGGRCILIPLVVAVSFGAASARAQDVATSRRRQRALPAARRARRRVRQQRPPRRSRSRARDGRPRRFVPAAVWC